jgi:chromosome segregation ATPase
MFYKEIKKLKKSELQDLLATTLQQKATLERANASIVSDLESKNTELNKWWSNRYNDLQNDIIDTSKELLETEKELVEVRASLIEIDTELLGANKRIKDLEGVNNHYYDTIKELESDYIINKTN